MRLNNELYTVLLPNIVEIYIPDECGCSYVHCEHPEHERPERSSSSVWSLLNRALAHRDVKACDDGILSDLPYFSAHTGTALTVDRRRARSREVQSQVSMMFSFVRR